MKQKFLTLSLSLVLTLSLLTGCGTTSNLMDEYPILDEYETQTQENPSIETAITVDLNEDYTPWVEVNNNIPYFTEEEKTSLEPFEIYSELDELGRCGVAYANICQELMPTEERESIGQVKPSGWHTVKYNCVDGKYLYNRCHLIGFQLAGENANERNLITGTRYLNIQGMLDFENEIAEYVKETNNHVLYRVTPQFTGDNLLCDGLLMEAYSVEDNGEGVQFCVFAYNIQPKIEIDYTTGESWLSNENKVENITTKDNQIEEEHFDLILNTNSKKYHKTTCNSVNKISESNKESYNGTLSWLEENGYTACGNCFN